jgi:hypothetical protein
MGDGGVRRWRRGRYGRWRGEAMEAWPPQWREREDEREKERHARIWPDSALQ